MYIPNEAVYAVFNKEIHLPLSILIANDRVILYLSDEISNYSKPETIEIKLSNSIQFSIKKVKIIPRNSTENVNDFDAVFYRTYPLLYHKFENILIFW